MNEQLLSAQVARDLFYIHENRIDAYKELLSVLETDPGMNNIIERMIEQGIKDREQLLKRMKPGVDSPGETYKAWQMMINPVTEGDKKTVLATLAEDELIMMNT